MASEGPQSVLKSLLLAVLMLTAIPIVAAYDTDGDGIEDHNDDCQLAAGNSSVDRDGCPDKDGDGTSDWNDRWTIPSTHFLNQQTLTAGYDYYSVDHSPDGEFVVTGDENGWVRIWNTSTQTNVLSAQMNNDVAQVAWSDDGSMVAGSTNRGSSADDELQIWWAENMTIRHSAINVDVESGDDDTPGNLAFNNDGSLIAIAIGRAGNSGTNGQVKIINTSSGLEERSLNPNGEDQFDSVAWSPDGSRIVVGGNDDMWIYDTLNWQQNRSMTGVASSTIADLAWSPDGNWISTCESWGGSGSMARFFNAHTGVKAWEKSHSTSCMSTDISPDGRMVAYSMSYYQGDGATVRIYDTTSGTAEDSFSAPRPGGCTGGGGSNNCGTIYGLSWAPDGQHIVSAHGRNDEGLYFWHVDLDPDQDGWNTTDQGDGKEDQFPIEPSQWNDTDMDGYGDNQAPAHEPDSCPTTFGLSNQDRFGCPDTDGDGYSDADSGWTFADGADYFPLDPLQWADADLDGYGDTYYYTTGPPPLELHLNQSGDAFPTDATQWNDTDGDGYGDNYEDSTWTGLFRCHPDIGCVGELLLSANMPDAFPLDRYQFMDTDGDWYGDEPLTPRSDGCPTMAGNSTYDRLGCPDSDGDGWSDGDSEWNAHPGGEADAFPNDPTQWRDSDGDGYGDNSSGNNPDECPGEGGVSGHPPSWRDRLGCPDRDGDGWSNAGDAMPDDPTQWLDRDGDGYGDNESGNNPDTFPDDPTQWRDSDGDGYGDNPTGPLGDWWANDPTQWQDFDGDGFGDNASGTNGDMCPTEFGEATEPTIRGCPDSDSDGVVDLEDAFPEDPFQISDSDGDGFGDNSQFSNGDDCPDVAGSSTEGFMLGCLDGDGDGWADEIDVFPEDGNQWVDTDGDGYGDNYLWGNQSWEDPDDPGQFIILRDEEGDFYPTDASQWHDRDGDGRGDNPEGTHPDAFPDRVTQQTDMDLDGYGDNVTYGAFQPDDCRSDYGESWRNVFGCPDADGDGQSDRDDICPWDPDFWIGSPDDCVISEPSTAGEGLSGESSFNVMYILAGVIAILLAALLITQVAKQSARRSGKVLVDEDRLMEIQQDRMLEEQERAQKWIDYYVGQGMFDKAKELGWQDPNDIPEWKKHEMEQAAAQESAMPTMVDLDRLL